MHSRSSNPFRFTILLTLLIVIFVACATSRLSEQARQIKSLLATHQDTREIMLMANSPYETSAYLFETDKAGPTFLILGGTHGNEPAGYEAAYRLLRFFLETDLKSGRVFIIPEANKLAVQKGTRRIPVPEDVDKEKGNLNRCYPGDPEGLPMERMAWEVMRLAQENDVDVFIDMHESPIFHLESVEDGRMRLGQSIVYHPDEESAWLAMLAVDELNAGITNRLETFSLVEKPIEHSAAWAAGTELNIAAFTVETCKKLPLEKRIDYHVRIVKRMLQEKGVL